MLFRLAGQNYLFIGMIAAMFLLAFGVQQVFAPGGGRIPSVTTDEQVYSVWGKAEGGPYMDVMFASTTPGKDPVDYVNLSNTPDMISEEQLLSANGEKITVTWWETNPANPDDSIPVIRTSVDGGLTFSKIVNLDSLADR